MIKESTEALLESNSEALVNTVNTVGVMGKGIALLFKNNYKENYRRYRVACRKNEIQIGKVFCVQVRDTQKDLYGDKLETHSAENPRWIINFPTKQHWRNPSKIEWIEAGLIDLKRVIKEKGIKSISLPQLGCGNGGLVWEDVKIKIEEAFAEVKDVEIIVHIYTDK